MVEDVGKVAEFINSFGVTAVIIAMFLVVFIAILIYILNTNKKMMESERETATKVLESMLNNYTADFKKPAYEEKNIVNIFMELDQSLKKDCAETLEKSKSDRTAIYVFHNGMQASHGLPFFKMSCISEKVSQKSIGNLQLREHTAMPLSLFDKIVGGLYYDGFYRITDEGIIDAGDRIFIKNTKLKDCFFFPIYDDENNMMGFILNGYNDIIPDKDIAKETEILKELAEKAKPVIQFSKCQTMSSSNTKRGE